MLGKEEKIADGFKHNPEDFVPGSYGCHEAMHMASRLGQFVDRELCEHPAIMNNPKWLALARKGADSLYELYQEIGCVHMEEMDD